MIHGHEGVLPCQYVSTLRGWEASSSWRCSSPTGGSRSPLLVYILKFSRMKGSTFEFAPITNGLNELCSTPRIQVCHSLQRLIPNQTCRRPKISPRRSNADRSLHSQRQNLKMRRGQQQMKKYQQSTQSRGPQGFV
jgi:hypothetical protein